MSRKGKGWHGDPRGHSKAARLGWARRKNGHVRRARRLRTNAFKKIGISPSQAQAIGVIGTGLKSVSDSSKAQKIQDKIEMIEEDFAAGIIGPGQRRERLMPLKKKLRKTQKSAGKAAVVSGGLGTMLGHQQQLEISKQKHGQRSRLESQKYTQGINKEVAKQAARVQAAKEIMKEKTKEMGKRARNKVGAGLREPGVDMVMTKDGTWVQTDEEDDEYEIYV